MKENLQKGGSEKKWLRQETEPFKSIWRAISTFAKSFINRQKYSRWIIKKVDRGDKR